MRLGELTPEFFEAFLNARDLNSRSRYWWLSHVSVFYQWALLHEVYARNPIAKLQRPKVRRLLPFGEGPMPTLRCGFVCSRGGSSRFGLGAAAERFV